MDTTDRPPVFQNRDNVLLYVFDPFEVSLDGAKSKEWKGIPV